VGFSSFLPAILTTLVAEGDGLGRDSQLLGVSHHVEQVAVLVVNTRPKLFDWAQAKGVHGLLAMDQAISFRPTTMLSRVTCGLHGLHSGLKEPSTLSQIAPRRVLSCVRPSLLLLGADLAL